MVEVLTSQDYRSAESSSEIITDISNISRQISGIYSLRDVFPDRYLPPEDWSQARKLHAVKDQRTIDLLLQRKINPGDEIHVAIQKFPGEEPHPFSMNSVLISVPSIEKPGSEYVIKTELSDLRRDGVAIDSLEAIELLGETSDTAETEMGFIYRTNEELVKIRKAIKDAKKTVQKNDDSLEELEALSARLITDRLIPLRNGFVFPPNSSLSIYMYEDRTGRVLGESANLTLRGKVFEFETSGQRLFPAINKLGGYDKIVTLIS